MVSYVFSPKPDHLCVARIHFVVDRYLQDSKPCLLFEDVVVSCSVDKSYSMEGNIAAGLVVHVLLQLEARMEYGETTQIALERNKNQPSRRFLTHGL